MRPSETACEIPDAPGRSAAAARPVRVVALVNPAAGAAERQPDRFRDALLSAFEAAGVAAEVELVPGDRLLEAAERAAGKARRAEIDGIVVGGGDGSIHTVAGVLAGTGIPLGVLPLGTLNHFAKDLGIPADVAGAAAVIAQGHAKPVDVAEVNGLVFVNNSSIGIYPYMVLDRERRRRMHGRAKWVAMALAAVRTLQFFPLRRLEIRIAGSAEPCRTPCVFVGSNEYGLGPRSFGRRERLDRGELWLCVARPQSRLSLLWLAFRSVIGLLHQSRDLQTFRTGSAEIVSHRKRLLVAVDGEVAVLRPPLRYRTRPGALRVFVPVETRPS
ncbi:MAG TPA: diacylglycerol kinase family protein [Beijerinckiaceae bacterium]|jgi:diacylglycerol kinase family enzyme